MKNPKHRFWGKLICCIALLLNLSFSALCSEISEGESQQESTGHPCVGYHHEEKTWGWAPHGSPKRITCTENHAYIGCFQLWSLWGNCCPLPKPDILTEEHQFSVSHCPDQHIVTGLQGDDPSCKTPGRHCLPLFRCTKVNTEGYRLGPAQEGIRWGIDSSSAFPWIENKQIRLDEIPLAVRYGIARVNRHHIYQSGCVGNPIGSVLVGRKGGKCKDTLWREILEISGKKEKRVKMFPDCKRLEKIHTEAPVCVK